MIANSNHPLIYAITLNWNRPADTLACLKSLVGQTAVDLHLLVVDNGSTDDSVAQVQAAYPDVELIVNPKNLGFAAGINVGLRHALAAGADYVLLVNNDTVLDPQMTQRLLAAMAEDVAMATALIYYYDEPNLIWAIGGRLNNLTLEQMGEQRGQPDPGGWPEILERDMVPACGVLVARTALEKVGLFDEDFFMYYEDADLCRRLRQAGFRILLVPVAKMWHKVSLSSGGKDSPQERYAISLASLIYFRKHAQGWRWLFIIPWRLGSALRTTLRLSLGRKWPALRAYWRGLIDGWRQPIS